MQAPSPRRWWRGRNGRPSLRTGREGAAGIPPVLLSLRDGREGYDVTTPATVFATWNVLSQGRGAMATLGAFRAIALEAAAGLAAALAARQEAVTGRPAEVPGIPVSTLAELAASLPEAAAERLAARATALGSEGLSLPDQNRLLAEEAWRLSGRSGPAILLGFGALPYLPVHLGHGPEAQGLRAALDRARAAVEAAHGCRIGTMEFFPGISDLSFFGEGGCVGGALHGGEHAGLGRHRLERADRQPACGECGAVGAVLSHAARAPACALCLRRAAGLPAADRAGGSGDGRTLRRPALRPPVAPAARDPRGTRLLRPRGAPFP